MRERPFLACHGYVRAVLYHAKKNQGRSLPVNGAPDEATIRHWAAEIAAAIRDALG